MSTLTYVIQQPANAAAELERLRAELTMPTPEYAEGYNDGVVSMVAERDALRERVARLTWTLRAIDTRLHAEEAAAQATHWPCPDSGWLTVSRRTWRQMCNVAVSVTAERPEAAA